MCINTVVKSVDRPIALRGYKKPNRSLNSLTL